MRRHKRPEPEQDKMYFRAKRKISRKPLIKQHNARKRVRHYEISGLTRNSLGAGFFRKLTYDIAADDQAA